MTAVPCIAIHPVPDTGWFRSADENALSSLVATLFQARSSADATVGQLIAELVQEGRRFRETDSGKRWVSVLENSRLATNGWMLWNLLDLDRHLTHRDELANGDTPAALLEDVLRQLQSAKIEELVELANAIWTQQASEAPAHA